MDRVAIEGLLIQEIDARGARRLNQLRDEAREVGEALGWQEAFALLEGLIAAIQSTRPAKLLKSRAARLYHLGKPYDSDRVALFESLATYLLRNDASTTVDYAGPSIEEYEVFAFFESYFSNFIEGTEFTVDEAERIVFDGEDIPTQYEDSHDVRALYKLCSDPQTLRLPLANEGDFNDWMRHAHGFLLEKRPSKRPGKLKIRANRAGDTEFVRPDYVIGTIAEGLRILTRLRNPFSRAVFLMFLVSEVHPFDDGNGRMARLIANAELSDSGVPKIILPTVYREDYLLGLRALTRRGEPDAYVKMLRKIWHYSSVIPCTSLAVAREFLERTQAFKFSSEGVIMFGMDE